VIKTDRRPGRRQTAEAVAEAVDGLGNVFRYSGFNTGTLIPGGRVDGISLSDSEVTVHIVVDVELGESLVPLGVAASSAVRIALDGLGDTRAVSIVIEDFAVNPAASDAIAP
jgi:hypothetical protein